MAWVNPRSRATPHVSRESEPARTPDIYDAQTAHAWCFESTLARARWVAPAACLLLVPLVSRFRWPLLMVTALGLLIGNAWLSHALHGQPAPAQLITVRRLATALDWGVVLGVIGLFGEESDTPGLLLVLVLTGGARFGRRGITWSGLSAGLFIAILLGAQAGLVDEVTAPDAAKRLVIWWIVLGVVALTVAELLRANGARSAPRPEGPVQETSPFSPAHRGSDCHLSRREREVLRLLVETDMTFAQIGDHLAISQETVKTHVHHIGQKLGARGRHGIVAVVRERAILAMIPIESPTPSASDIP